MVRKRKAGAVASVAGKAACGIFEGYVEGSAVQADEVIPVGQAGGAGCGRGDFGELSRVGVYQRQKVGGNIMTYVGVVGIAALFDGDTAVGESLCRACQNPSAETREGCGDGRDAEGDTLERGVTPWFVVVGEYGSVDAR